MHTEVGTSLGLSILRGMLEKNGCSVKMVSELGVGTTFWFDLPLEEVDSDEMQVHGQWPGCLWMALSNICLLETTESLITG